MGGHGLEFFRKTNSERSWNIASFHSPHSLTWSWILSFSMFRGDERRLWPIISSYPNNTGFHFWLRVPFIGMFTFSRQHEMYYRDLWRRERDERDGLIKGDDDTPPPPRTPIIVINGGQSLH